MSHTFAGVISEDIAANGSAASTDETIVADEVDTSFHGGSSNWTKQALSVVVVGASGTAPAFQRFSHCSGLYPFEDTVPI